MKNRLSGILLGILLIITGIIFYFKDMLSINAGTLLLFIIGVMFLILYFAQNKKWSLIFGVYLIYFSLIGIINSHELFLFNGIKGFFYISGGFICCPGVIFDVIYIRERKPGQLTAGLAFTAAGISVMAGIPFFDGVLTGIGVSLVTDSITGKRKKNIIQTVIGIFIIILGLRSIINLFGLTRLIITMLFIIWGGYLIFKSILKERD